MIKNWKPARLGDFTEFRNGVNFGREDEGAGIPIVKVKDFGDLHHVPLDGLDQLDRDRVQVPKNQLLRRNDILLVRSNGNAALVGRSMIFNGPDDEITFSGFSIRARVDRARAHPAFVHYWLRSGAARSRFAREGNGTGIQNLSQVFLSDLRIELPPLHEQRAIAATLGALDDKIELNRKMNATLEAMARALFRDWFVDFGPTRAKMAGRPPYLSPDLWSLFPDRLDAEGKPEGWENSRLSDYMTFRGGSQPPAKEFINAPAPGYVRLLQIRDFDSDNHLTFIPDSPRLRKVETDDICIGRYGSGTGDEKDSLGRLCRGLSGAINVALVNVIPSFACREWLATFIGSGDFRRAVSGGSARAVQAGFKKEDLDHIKVVRASDAVHSAFEAFGRYVWEKRKQSIAENETLAQTRDLLLPRLMSAELRVASTEGVA